MGAMASQITSLTIVHPTVYSGADQRKHQNSASLAFVQGMHRSPVNSPYKGPVTRKMFPLDDVIIHPVIKGPTIRRTSSDRSNFVSSSCRKSDLSLTKSFTWNNKLRLTYMKLDFKSITHGLKHYYNEPYRHWGQDGGWYTISILMHAAV